MKRTRLTKVLSWAYPLSALFSIIAYYIWMTKTMCMAGYMQHPPYPIWIHVLAATLPYYLAVVIALIYLIEFPLRRGLMFLLPVLFLISLTSRFWQEFASFGSVIILVLPWAIVYACLSLPCFTRYHLKYTFAVPIVELGFILLAQWRIFSVLYLCMKETLLDFGAPVYTTSHTVTQQIIYSFNHSFFLFFFVCVISCIIGDILVFRKLIPLRTLILSCSRRTAPAHHAN